MQLIGRMFVWDEGGLGSMPSTKNRKELEEPIKGICKRLNTSIWPKYYKSKLI